MSVALLLAAILSLGACSRSPLQVPPTGHYELPAGVVEVHRPIVVPAGAEKLVIDGHPSGTVLRAASDFQGRAVISLNGARGVTLRNFTIDGNRAALGRPIGLPPSDVPFIDYYTSNGIAANQVEELRVERVRFQNIAGFAVLIARSRNVSLRRLEVSDSGSRNERNRNNTSGGVLFEEGAHGFELTNSRFRKVLGNAVWTHSNYTSPRNANGLISENHFEEIARDAIQIGHAHHVRVDRNQGRRIGYPVDAIDIESGAIPVAIDTAGNVSDSSYAANRFDEINGKCIDLDGFHDGSVTGNICVNSGTAKDYPYGHFGIVMNNTNPDMQSENIVIEDNVIDGAKFGGIFVIGSGHLISHNRLVRLNQAGCNESAAKYGCAHFEGEPDLLQSGIYLGQRAERPAVARDNRIIGNLISGYRMKTRCIGMAPKAAEAHNEILGNRCEDAERRDE